MILDQREAYQAHPQAFRQCLSLPSPWQVQDQAIRWMSPLQRLLNWVPVLVQMPFVGVVAAQHPLLEPRQGEVDHSKSWNWQEGDFRQWLFGQRAEM
jgi:hypothetical protein